MRNADVMARIRLLGKHLERLRVHMGRMPAPQPAIRVRSAALREVFFAAKNLHRRVAALKFELLRQATPWRQRRPSEVQPEAVFARLNLILTTVSTVEESFGLEAPLEESPVEGPVEAAALMNALIEQGALVDSLLEEPGTVSEAYTGITYVTHVALDLHRVTTGKMMPAEPPLEAGRTMREVLMELIACTELLSSIFQRLEVPVADIDFDKEHGREIEADTLSDLIAILVAELRWLSARVPGTRPPLEPYAAGPQLPSDLHQRTRLLKAILVDIEAAPELIPESITR